jgi:hypothetical protein
MIVMLGEAVPMLVSPQYADPEDAGVCATANQVVPLLLI